jgi:outer membrane protein OmpA-like peptidoglycan-associated protein
MIAFICCSATSGLELNVSIDSRRACPFREHRRKRWYHSSVGRVGIAWVVLACLGAPAHADPLEASGFVGVVGFGETELGNSWAPEQVPGTAAQVGARVAWLAVPQLAGREGARLQLALEGELALASSFTGGTDAGGRGARMSYFAPVFGWRAHAMLRLDRPSVRPHLVVGGGGETVASSSPFMAKETDPVAYWGPGMTLAVTERWQLRVDLRHGLMPARETGATSTFELQFGFATSFGAPVPYTRPPPPRAETEITVDDQDGDKDGLPDRLDRCPDKAETVNGITDGDGCPEADPDNDGVLGDSDRCPDKAEDLDKFADDDGCPDLDNDNDTIADAQDTCPLEPETKNGITDGDGCPDAIPAEVTAAFATLAAQKFERSRARLTAPIKTALEPVLAQLHGRPELKITIVGHPGAGVPDDLAKRRAEAVKWYLVDQGVMPDRLETRVAAGVSAVSIVLR